MEPRAWRFRGEDTPQMRVAESRSIKALVLADIESLQGEGPASGRLIIVPKRVLGAFEARTGAGPQKERKAAG
jgi:hypothetical protein